MAVSRFFFIRDTFQVVARETQSFFTLQQKVNTLVNNVTHYRWCILIMWCVKIGLIECIWVSEVDGTF